MGADQRQTGGAKRRPRGPRAAVRLAGLCAAALHLLMLTGCGSQPFDQVAVYGTLKYDDGTLIPAEQITVYFVPQAEAVDAKTHPRPGWASVNVEDGSFSNVTTYEFGDGAIAGQNKIYIRASGPLEQPSGAVPDIYTDVSTTLLKVNVSSSEREHNLTIPRPSGSSSAGP